MTSVDLTDMELTTPAPAAPIIDDVIADPHGGWGPQSLLIRQIRRDGGTQARVGLDEDTVQEYAELMREHRWDFASLQRPIVLYDGSDFWLADGFHRIEAAQRAGLSDFRVDVLRGGKRDAILRAAGANSQHGLRRTNADKRRAVELLLKDEEWRQWSDRKIAQICAVSDPFVGSVRKQLSANGLQMPETRTIERSGTTYQMTPAAPVSKPEPVTPADLLKAGVQLVRHGAWWQPVGFSGELNGWTGTAQPWDLAVHAARAAIEERARPDAPAGWTWRENSSLRHTMSGIIIAPKATHAETIAAAEAYNVKAAAVANPAKPIAPAADPIEAEIKRLCAICGARFLEVPILPYPSATRYRIEWPNHGGGGDYLADEALARLRAACEAKEAPAVPAKPITPAPRIFEAAPALPDDVDKQARIRELATPLGLLLAWEDDGVILYWPEEANQLDQLEPMSYARAIDWLITDAERLRPAREEIARQVQAESPAPSYPLPSAAKALFLADLDATLPKDLERAGYYWESASPLVLRNNDGWRGDAPTIEGTLELARVRERSRTEGEYITLPAFPAKNAPALMESIAFLLEQTAKWVPSSREKAEPALKLLRAVGRKTLDLA